MKIEVSESVFDKANFAYTLFCLWLEKEKSSVFPDDVDSFKKSFAFLSLEASCDGLESNYLEEDLPDFLS